MIFKWTGGVALGQRPQHFGRGLVFAGMEEADADLSELNTNRLMEEMVISNSNMADLFSIQLVHVLEKYECNRKKLQLPVTGC
jgi:hypothetical protein